MTKLREQFLNESSAEDNAKFLAEDLRGADKNFTGKYHIDKVAKGFGVVNYFVRGNGLVNNISIDEKAHKKITKVLNKYGMKFMMLRVHEGKLVLAVSKDVLGL